MAVPALPLRPANLPAPLQPTLSNSGAEAYRCAPRVGRRQGARPPQSESRQRRRDSALRKLKCALPTRLRRSFPLRSAAPLAVPDTGTERLLQVTPPRAHVSRNRAPPAEACVRE